MQTASKVTGANESDLETAEESFVALRANHSRKVMTHRSERAHEEKNVLRRPASLHRGEDRN